jgi:hypothetical protein
MSWSQRLYAPAVSRHGHALAVAAAAAAAVGAILVVGLVIDAQAPTEAVLQSSNSTAISIRPVTPPQRAVAQPTVAVEAEAEAAAPIPAKSIQPTEQRPAFDVLRLEPDGAAVIAGHASSNAALELRADGRVVAQATADRLGDFTISPPPFAVGPHRLELATRSGTSPPVLSDPVAIDVPRHEAEAPAPPSSNAAGALQAAPVAASSTEASLSETILPGANIASASEADGVTVVARSPMPPPRPKFARLPTKYSEVRSVKGSKTSIALLPLPQAAPSSDRGGHTTK